jgi:hypothetical protein
MEEPSRENNRSARREVPPSLDFIEPTPSNSFAAIHAKKTWACPTSLHSSSGKLREVVAEEMKGRVVGGEGKTAEVDDGYFGGYVKPANQKEYRQRNAAALRKTGEASEGTEVAHSYALRQYLKQRMARPAVEMLVKKATVVRKYFDVS